MLDAPARFEDAQGYRTEEQDMKLTLLGSESEHGDSPTLYATDRDTVVVQGWRVTDVEALDKMAIPEHETVVEIPLALLRFAPSVEPEC